MLTVKLCKGHTIKIVEATEVNVYNCGPAPGSEQDPGKRTGDVREIAGSSWDGKSFAFYIVDPDRPIPEDHYGFARDVEFWHCAYIENAHGATTETVRAYWRRDVFVQPVHVMTAAEATSDLC
jgi:hypothetical protein